MKKSISYIMLFFCLSFMSCNKWLDVPSKEEVIDYEMFKTEQGFMDAMAGVYFLMGDNGLYGDMLTMTFLDVLAHRYYVNVYDVDKLGVNLGQANYYQQDRVTPVVNSIWQKGYNVIANVNSILEQIEDYKSVFSDDNYRLIKGEALGVRAFMHFDLLRMFGNSYRTGADSLAIPYVTTLSGRVWPLFDTGNGVINLALRDLQVADSLLSIDDIHASSIENQWINNRQQHFNHLAVYATMARIYHWQGDVEKALFYANKVIDARQLPFFNPENWAMNSRDVAFSTEIIFSLYKDDLKDVYSKRVGSITNSILDNEVEDIELLYEIGSGGSTDYRFTWLWNLYNDPNGGGSRYMFYRYNASVTASGLGNLVSLIRLAEMYYIAAECSGNTVAGRAYLNEVRVNRGLKKLAEDITDKVFQDEICKEYQKEFFSEGQLFYYYKRRGQMTIVDHDNTSYVDMSSQGYVFPIPEDELELRRAITIEL